MARLSRLSRSVTGKVALVTGAASGMGRATAHLFADEGMKVAVTDREEQGVAKVVAEITEAGGQAVGWSLERRCDNDAGFELHGGPPMSVGSLVGARKG